MNNGKPFFSIVIPVYNSERYLNECIESVFSQSCDDFELILVDDESTDMSSLICDEWQKKYPSKIKVIHQNNTGVYIAKRNGIKATNGQFIYVIDNDDLIISTEMFEMIKQEIVNKGCDLVVFNAIDNLHTNHLLCNLPFEDREEFEGHKLSKIYDEYLRTKSLHHIWMMVFSRELFDWDYVYDKEYRMLRDGPSLTLPIISNAKKILYLKDVFYYWRIQNRNSASKHYDVIGFYNSIRYLHEQIKEYSQKWMNKSAITDTLVKSSYVTDICIAAIKARSISPTASITKNEFIRQLSDDEVFRKEFTTQYLETYRKIIAYALYRKQIWLISIMSSTVGLIKNR